MKISSTNHIVHVLVVSVVLIVVGAISGLLVLQGVVPYASRRIVIAAPLYPYNFTYAFSISVTFGYGSYVVKVHSESDMNITVSFVSSGETRKLYLKSGESTVVKVEKGNGVFITVVSRVRPYQTYLGVIEVARGLL